MTLRRQRILIWAFAIMVISGSPVVLLLGLTWPVQVRNIADRPLAGANMSSDSQNTIRQSSTNTDNTPADLTTLRQVSGIDLRRPLFDDPVADEQSNEPEAPPPAMTLRLVGTISEPGRSLAVFQKQDGSIALCGEGEKVEDGPVEVTVVRVERERVDILFGDQQRELRVVGQEARGVRR